MSGRVPQGLELEDRLVFGLTASRLAFAGGGAIVAYGLLRAWPLAIALPLALLATGGGAAVAWIRIQHRTLDAWALMFLRFFWRARLVPRLRLALAAAASPADDLARKAVEGGKSAGELSPPDLDRAKGLTPTGDEAPSVADGEEAEAGPGGEGPDDEDEGEARADRHEADVSRPEEVVISFPVKRSRPFLPPAAGPAPAFTGPARRIVAFSLKGGVGRTALLTEMAAMLGSRARHADPQSGRARPLQVTAIDLDLGNPGIGPRLGLHQPDWWDRATELNPPSAADHLVTHRETGVRLLLGPRRPIRPEAPMRGQRPIFSRLLAEVEAAGAQVILVDVATDLGEVNRIVLEWAHEIYLVTTSGAAAVHATYRAAEGLSRLGLTYKVRLVEQMASPGPSALGEVLSDLDLRLAGRIPMDAVVQVAENRHRPLALAAPDSPAAEAIAALAAQLWPAIGMAPTLARPSLLRRALGQRTSA